MLKHKTQNNYLCYI